MGLLSLWRRKQFMLYVCGTEKINFGCFPDTTFHEQGTTIAFD